MKLFYRSYGFGPPLIILHGLYGSSDNWVTIAKKLSEFFTVILPDQRNHGQSPHNDVNTYSSMSDDLSELATDLKLSKFFLAGHSMGGKTAIAFALRWPERLNGLLIADITPFVNETEKENIRSDHFKILTTILSVDTEGISSRSEIEKKIAEKLDDENVRGFILKNLKRDEDNRFRWKLNARALLDNLDLIMEGIDPATWISQQISGFPVIFLRGERSGYIPESHFPEIKRVFPAAEFVTIPGAGHWIHADAPDDVIKQIKRLLDS